jgi:HlyD family secretion protein
MRKVLLVLLGLAVAAGAAVAVYFVWLAPPPAELLLHGTVEIQEVRLGSKYGGRVQEAPVREGQVVEPGTVLVRFETPELTAKHEQLRNKLLAAEADQQKADYGPRDEEIAEADANVKAAQARLDRVLAGYREEEKRQAKHDLEVAVADQKFTQDEFLRIQQLPVGAASRSDLDNARAARDRAANRVASAQDRLDMVTTGSREEDKAEARAQLNQFKAHLDLLKAGTRIEDRKSAAALVAQTRAELDEVEAELREAVVKAPEKAVIEVLSVRPGDLVAANVPVVQVLRADDLWVKAFVPSTQLGKVRLGQQVSVTVDSYPGRPFVGTIIFIASASEFTPRNVQSASEREHQVFAIKVHVDDPEGVFKSGMAAEVTVPLRGAP